MPADTVAPVARHSEASVTIWVSVCIWKDHRSSGVKTLFLSLKIAYCASLRFDEGEMETTSGGY